MRSAFGVRHPFRPGFSAGYVALREPIGGDAGGALETFRGPGTTREERAFREEDRDCGVEAAEPVPASGVSSWSWGRWQGVGWNHTHAEIATHMDCGQYKCNRPHTHTHTHADI